MTKTSDTKAMLGKAADAAEAKKANRVTVLELEKGSGAFTDYFLICSGSNPRQIQAISDEVEEQLSAAGHEPAHIEGYTQAEWVLLDYVDFVVHVFSDKARDFYDLERLWKSAKHLAPEDLKPRPRRPRAKAASEARPTSARTRTTRTRKV